MSSQRLFVAIDLPSVISDDLRQICSSFGGLNFVPPEQMHLTLAFFPAVAPANVSALMEKLRQIVFRAFFLPVTGLSTFSRKGTPSVLWIGVGSAHPHLFQLHKRVNEAALACDLPIEERAWRPHFTIARLREAPRGPMESFLKKHRELDAGMFRVEEFHLYESRVTSSGAFHTRLLTVTAS